MLLGLTVDVDMDIGNGNGIATVGRAAAVADKQ